MALRVIAVGVALLSVCCGSAFAAAGDLDPSFSGDGVHTADLGGADSASGVAVQPDGRIVVAGQGTTGSDIVVLRLTTAGAPDPSFDGDGAFSYDFGGTESGSGVALQPNGRILVSGATSSGTNDGVVLAVQPNGGVDTSFSGDGLDRLWSAGAASALLVQPDGKVVLTGGGTDFWVARLTSDGARDESFASGGAFGFGFALTSESANAIARAPDGGLVLAGAVNSNIIDWAITRLDPGDEVSEFGDDGWVLRDLGSQDSAQAVVVQPDGKIVVAGGGGVGGASFAVMRLNVNGTPDPSFGGTGTVFLDGFGGGSFANAVALQADGKLLLAGTSNGQMAVARLQPNGILDTTFSGDGRATVDVGPYDTANAMALQPDGRIVLAGGTAQGMVASDSIAVARLQGDPPVAGLPGPGPGIPGPGSPLRCGGKRATIVGTARKDKLRGTRRADVIAALGANDSVKGGGGNDLICGGSGDDSLAGEAGRDRLLGDAGKDKLGGGTGNDALSGGPGKDLLTGGTGNDALNGGPDTDRLLGQAGRDKLAGGPGRKDLCTGGDGRDKAACERERA